MAGFKIECWKWLVVGLVCASACGQPSGAAVDDGGGGGGDTGLTMPGGSGSTSGGETHGSTGAIGGSMAGTGGGSSGGVAAVGCNLPGGDFPSGAANPGDPCQICDPNSSLQAWSQLPDGTACSAGDICQAGACNPGCVLGGAILLPGATEVGNDCQSCQPEVSTTAWTAVANDVACSSSGGNFCNSGACVPGCSVGGQIYSNEASAPTDSCEACQPADSATAFSAVADGTVCAQDGGNYCVSGSCQLVCDIDNTIVPDGTMQPNYPSACCNATLNPREWQRALQPMDGGLAVGGGVQGAFLVDMNGDGKLDLVVGTSSEVDFFLGNGDGTFGPVTGTPSSPGLFAIADINGDGRPDFIQTFGSPGSTSQVRALLNTSNSGQFSFSSISDTVPGPVVALAVGDFQGTGRAQMAVVSGPSSTAASFTLLSMQTTGTFVTVGTYGLPFANPAVAVAGKFGGGTKDELAIVDGVDQSFAIFHYMGGLFGFPAIGPAQILPVSSANLSIAQADVNQDGLPDLLVGDVANDTLFVLPNAGASTFPGIGFLALPTPTSLVVGDINGDGLPDIASADGSNGINVLINETPAGDKGGATFAPIVTYPVVATTVAPGDLNGDGKLDMVAVGVEATTLLGSCP